jgi:glycosyltransferase involved in cell wall biosynthesis
LANSPQIGIALPFYGRLEDIEAVVSSILEQDTDEWRLRIFDDCSAWEGCEAWVKSIGDQRISYVRNKRNLGISGNFQRSLSESTSEYTVIVGQDDLLARNFVSKAIQLTNLYPEASIIQPGVTVIDSYGIACTGLSDRVKALLRPKVSGPQLLKSSRVAASLAAGNWAYFPSLIWKTREVQNKGFDKDLNVVLDLDLIFNILASNGIMCIDPTPIFYYRRHEISYSSVTATTGSRFVEERTVYDRYARTFRAKGWLSASFLARLRPTSRLNAVTHLSTAIYQRNWDAVRTLFMHVFL